MGTTAAHSDHPTRCSFCRKPAPEVGKLIPGPGVHTCDECVALAERIVAETVGEAFGITRQSAWKRFSGEE
ncbi:ClpX C4-type zinc finger protein [Streptomyces pseudogriseolus]|uniref:ClpX C4-type zinc finger protein n=1 Tax=Streptomyces pseudogriseolus TaxID=36817 RepID=UPI003FA1DB0A